MVSRALIIAIEDYPDVTDSGIAKHLDDTLKNAIAFKDWVEKKWLEDGLADGDTEMVFCSEPKQDFGKGASRRDIVKALKDMKTSGQNMTDELFVYFSGHGYSFSSDASRSDIIITSDFESSELSSHCCLNLDFIVNWLRSHLGIGKHFYFIDACRLDMTAQQIAPSGEFLSFDPSNVTGEPTTYVLHSTITNAASVVDGKFQKSLLDGLSGEGKAKVWDDNVADAMFVRYDSLRRYLTEKLKHDQPIEHQVMGQEGEADGILLTLRPVPEVKCTIRIKGVSGSSDKKILFKHIRARSYEEMDFTGTSITLSLAPGTYQFKFVDEDPLWPFEIKETVSLYDDMTLKLSKPELHQRDGIGDFLRGLSAVEMASRKGVPMKGIAWNSAKPRKNRRSNPRRYKIDAIFPSEMTAEFQHISSREISVLDESGEIELRGGSFNVTLLGSDGSKVSNEIFKVSASLKDLDLNIAANNLPMQRIAAKFPSDSGSPLFSESLMDEKTESELDMWLAIMGAGKILSRDEDTYSKLSRLPLQNFLKARSDRASIFLLAGFADPSTQFKVSISEGDVANWLVVDRENSFGLAQVHQEVDQGQYFVTVQLNDGMTITLSSFAIRNRCTFITVVQGPNGQPEIIQYMLPIGALTKFLPDVVKKKLEFRNSLRDVRQTTRMFKAFRARRRAFPETPNSLLQDILYQKWLDPISSSIAAYELMRRGQKDGMIEVATNMQKYFPDLPDTWAISRLAGTDVSSEKSDIPLFLEGFRTLPDYDDRSPFPVSHLDHSRPWTSWRGLY